MCVTKHLDLNVAWALHVLFDQHRIAAKAVDGFTFARCQRCGKVFRLFDHAHALATTTSAGFDEGGVTDAVGFALQQGRILVSTVVTGHQRHTRFLHQTLGFGLEAHGQNSRCRWADEHQTRGGAGLGKVFVLAQEAIARVHGLGTRVLRGLQDALPAQVAVFGCAAANVHRFVTRLHMLGPGIGVRINGHGLDAHSAGGGGHTASDFASVGDHYFLEHVSFSKPLGYLRRTTCR